MINDNTLRIFEMVLALFRVDIGQLTYSDICEYANEKQMTLHNTKFFKGIAQDNIWELQNLIEDCKIHQFNKIRP
jgi:hypothetical protein